MTEPAAIARQRTLLQELARLGAERTRLAPEIERGYQARLLAIEREYEENYQTSIIRFASAKERLDHEREERREALEAQFAAEQTAAEEDLDRERRRALAQYARAKAEAKTAYQETCWTTAAFLEGEKAEAARDLQEVQERVAAQIQQLQNLQQQADLLLTRWGQMPEPATPSARGSGDYRKLPECVATAEESLEELRELSAPGWSRGYRLPLLFALLGLVLLYPAVLLANALGGTVAVLGGWVYGPAAVVLLVGVAGTAITLWAKAVARAEVRRIYQPLAQAVEDAESSRQHILDFYNGRYKERLAEARKRTAREVRRAQRKYREKRAGHKKQRQSELRKVRDRFKQARADNELRHTEELRRSEEDYERRRAALQERFETESKEIHGRRQRLGADVRARFQREAQALSGSWQQGLARVRELVAEVNAESSRLFPDWSDPSWESWQPPEALPPVLRFGSYQVGLARSANGQPAREGTPTVEFTLPALCPCPEGCSLLLEADDGGREQAVRTLQTVMFRLLTTYPPGKVRFTILDPVGLGQNFAAFMHLADYHEALVGSRIWTEQAHIEQRLADMTAHMENVIQKYLRNQFATIEEYNAHAGEVAEPFRFLVAANFPVNFSVEAARRLVSIAQSGRRCGVHTLVTIDGRQPLPVGFNLADLEQAGVTLVWQDGRFVWRDPDFAPLPLTLDEPPPDDLATRLLHLVGTKARDAQRVEVPFEFIAAPQEQWWSGDSRHGVNVAIGRAGATKRQHLKLGQGTSQHVLVAGKTGSGKSTLLHALITNLALFYSPDELELFLIDFKKGVEFKTYAVHELPHARVVAIESEREFGLSVLQRLDAELRARGERFRAVGAQDVAAFRQAEPNTPLPRILLVVDEFQEFFTEDDRIAGEAAQLLDRLVRQGRAFGLHVLLGSQTLGGAYSLARSTIDQMAVRIALQCSEADAHLILSDDNSAARLLSRPGEAIYNDANGTVEGNNPFQVVWLPEAKREGYLESVRALARQRPAGGWPPPLIFEGNAPADLGKNVPLNRLLAADTWPAPLRAVQAWLGDSMSMKDAVAATFRPQGGSNLLIVGQQDEAALALLATALVSLTAQLGPNSGARFHVLDGTPVDSPHAGYLAKLAEALPQPVRLAGWRDAPGVVAEVAEEVARRQQATESQLPPVFLLVHGLQRFRDLRRSEDDFGFSRMEGERASPAQQFATVLREGAALGVHVLLWCDSLNNLNRGLDRQALREFEMRVLFQMSVADSSNLIDTPLASKLGAHRAYFASEEQGRLEKFRPYGLPPEEWVAWVRDQLHNRGPVAVPGASA